MGNGLTSSLPCRLLDGLVLLHAPLHLIAALRGGNVLHADVDLLRDDASVHLHTEKKKKKETTKGVNGGRGTTGNKDVISVECDMTQKIRGLIPS